jgi:glyoxylase-like metal-dependent hydrolase (beta-lactamase superfamily II)
MQASTKLGFDPCTGCRTQGQVLPAQSRLPSKTFSKTDDLSVDGVRIQLYHWGAGHTGGDAVVYLPEEKLVFAGDLLVNTHPEPLIHVEKKGSAAGWLVNVKGILSLDADTYMTGHGTIMTRAEVQAKYGLVSAKYSSIRAMVKEGKSLDEIKVARGEPNPPIRRMATRNLVSSDIIIAATSNYPRNLYTQSVTQACTFRYQLSKI